MLRGSSGCSAFLLLSPHLALPSAHRTAPALPLQTGAEPTYCMGDDSPLPVLASTPHVLYDYFKQRFAQVTNPPIDPLREGLVMSLEMRLGGRGNLLQTGEGEFEFFVCGGWWRCGDPTVSSCGVQEL